MTDAISGTQQIGDVGHIPHDTNDAVSNATNKLWGQTNVNVNRAGWRVRPSKPRGSIPVGVRSEKLRREHPEKYRAHLTVKAAILARKLIRQPCERCGSVKRVNAHHEDYSRPLDVTWLCPKHHMARHREIEAERQRNPTPSPAPQASGHEAPRGADRAGREAGGRDYVSSSLPTEPVPSPTTARALFGEGRP